MVAHSPPWVSSFFNVFYCFFYQLPFCRIVRISCAHSAERHDHSAEWLRSPDSTLGIEIFQPQTTVHVCRMVDLSYHSAGWMAPTSTILQNGTVSYDRSAGWYHTLAFSTLVLTYGIYIVRYARSTAVITAQVGIYVDTSCVLLIIIILLYNCAIMVGIPCLAAIGATSTCLCVERTRARASRTTKQSFPAIWRAPYRAPHRHLLSSIHAAKIQAQLSRDHLRHFFQIRVRHPCTAQRVRPEGTAARLTRLVKQRKKLLGLACYCASAANPML